MLRRDNENNLSRLLAEDVTGLAGTKRVTLTGDGSISIPALYFIRGIYIANSTANAVTGGIKIGTTAGGTQVVAAQAVAGNDRIQVAAADILIKSWTAAQTLFIQDVTSWNSASVTFVFDLVYMGP